MEDIYKIITIIIIIILILIALIWVYILKQKPIMPSPIEITASGYNSRCLLPFQTISGIDDIQTPEIYNVKNCSLGLECIKYTSSNIWGICKKSIGTQCSSLIECGPDAILCSGVCSRTTSGGLNQNGPCNSDNLILNDDNICKLTQSSQGCTISNDCITGSCQPIGGILTCVSQNENGGACIFNDDCISNYCDKINNISGYCQPNSITTGTIGASCTYNINSNPKCNAGLSCYIDFGLNQDQEYGECENIVTTWPQDICDTGASCIAPTMCRNTICEMPRNNQRFMTNSCSTETTGVCIDGYTCRNNTCVPNGIDIVPYSSSQTWGLVKFQRINNKIGKWTQICPITNLPSNSSSLSVLTYATNGMNTSDIIVYRSSSEWILLSVANQRSYPIIFTPLYVTQMNELYSPQPLFTFQISNVILTQGGGLLIVYSIIISGINIFRCYLYPVAPNILKTTPINGSYYNIDVRIYTSTISTSLNGWFQYTTSTNNQIQYLTTIKWINIDDRLDSNGNIKVLIIDSNNNLYSTIMPINYLNGINISTNNIFQYRASRITWAQFYSYAKGVQDPLEYVYMQASISDPSGNTNVLTSVSSGIPPNIQVPPPLNFNISPSPIIKQYIASDVGAGLGSLDFIYLINYPITIGGVQLRLFKDNVDVVMPGYFVSDARSQLTINSIISGLSFNDLTTYYMILPTSR